MGLRSSLGTNNHLRCHVMRLRCDQAAQASPDRVTSQDHAADEPPNRLWVLQQHGQDRRCAQIRYVALCRIVKLV